MAYLQTTKRARLWDDPVMDDEVWAPAGSLALKVSHSGARMLLSRSDLNLHWTLDRSSSADVLVMLKLDSNQMENVDQLCVEDRADYA